MDGGSVGGREGGGYIKGECEQSKGRTVFKADPLVIESGALLTVAGYRISCILPLLRAGRRRPTVRRFEFDPRNESIIIVRAVSRAAVAAGALQKIAALLHAQPVLGCFWRDVVALPRCSFSAAVTSKPRHAFAIHHCQVRLD